MACLDWSTAWCATSSGRMPPHIIGIFSAYAVPELETLESAYEWIDRLAAEATQTRTMNVPAFVSKRVRAKRAAAPSRPSAVPQDRETAHACEMKSALLRIGCQSERLLHVAGD